MPSSPSAVRRQRGLSIMDVVMSIVIIGILGTVSVMRYVDVQGEASLAVKAFDDGSMFAKLTAASRENYERAQRRQAGDRVAKWEYSCEAGYHIIQLLDDKRLQGGYAAFYYTMSDGAGGLTYDPARFWTLGPTGTIPHGDMRECYAERNGTRHTFFLWGCVTNCDCNDYPQDCGTY